jgi:TolB protein
LYRLFNVLVGSTLLSLLLISGRAQAILTIKITGGTEGAIPIAIVPFNWQGAAPQAPQDIAGIIASDLRRSGLFAPVAEKDLVARPHEAAEVKFPRWRALGTEALVVGQVMQDGPEQFEVRFQLLDVFGGRQLAGLSISAGRDELRRAAHHISDIVYERLLGKPGAFSTRIAYVTELSTSPGKFLYSLQVADWDGYSPQTILTSEEPILSPAWSKDGKRLAYVSFEQGRPSIFVQELSSGRREALTSYPGLNGAPTWSPDGRQLALTLSKDGNPEIYILDLPTGNLRRITDNEAIDTEPDWSPDGRWLVFTSDRGGRPQVYRVSVDGGRVQRLTFEGGYNTRPRYSPDGRLLAMVHGGQEGYRIAVMDVETRSLQVLTDTWLDESPSFAPNGSMLMYATQVGEKGILAAVSVDGRVRQSLAFQEGDIREPAWSPSE